MSFCEYFSTRAAQNILIGEFLVENSTSTICHFGSTNSSFYVRKHKNIQFHGNLWVQILCSNLCNMWIINLFYMPYFLRVRFSKRFKLHVTISHHFSPLSGRLLHFILIYSFIIIHGFLTMSSDYFIHIVTSCAMEPGTEPCQSKKRNLGL